MLIAVKAGCPFAVPVAIDRSHFPGGGVPYRWVDTKTFKNLTAKLQHLFLFCLNKANNLLTISPALSQNIAL
jgi:hypothetical protein